MTKKTFILTGLFLIALGPLSVALETFLMLSEIIPQREASIYGSVFRYVAIPLVFCLLIWKRFKHIGKSRKFTACCLAGFLAAFFISMILLPFLALYFGSYTVDALTNEIGVWAKSGGKGDFIVSTNAKIKMAIFHAITMALVNWPLFAALYFGARGPRTPRGNNPLNRPSKHAVEKNNSALSLREQIVS